MCCWCWWCLCRCCWTFLPCSSHPRFTTSLLDIDWNFPAYPPLPPLLSPPPPLPLLGPPPPPPPSLDVLHCSSFTSFLCWSVPHHFTLWSRALRCALVLWWSSLLLQERPASLTSHTRPSIHTRIRAAEHWQLNADNCGRRSLCFFFFFLLISSSQGWAPLFVRPTCIWFDMEPAQHLKDYTFYNVNLALDKLCKALAVCQRYFVQMMYILVH